MIRPGAYQIVLTDQTGAPEWIRLLPFGEIEMVDGRDSIRFDREGAEAIVAQASRRSTDLVIDYEHQSLGGEAPILAAGWIKEVEIRADGLWARVEWTPRARKYIEEREYRYFSPVLEVDNDRRIVGLWNVALTNTPAMADVLPLAATATAADRETQADRSRRYGIGVKEDGNVSKPAEWQDVPDSEWGDPVNYRYPCPTLENVRAAWRYWNMPKNRREYSDTEQQIITERIRRLAKKHGMEIREESMKAELVQMLHLPPEADEAAIIAAVAERGQAVGLVQELGQVLGLTEPTAAKVRGAVLALKEGRDRLSAVEQELQALKAERHQERARQAVEEAIKAGRVIPAQREWARQYAQSDPEGFAAYVATAPVQVPVAERPEARDQGPITGEGATGLSREELALCQAMGLAPEKFKAQQQREREQASERA